MPLRNLRLLLRTHAQLEEKLAATGVHALFSEGDAVRTVEERVAYLEGQVSEQSHDFGGIRDAIHHFEARADGRFEAVDRRFEAVEKRFDTIDRRFDAIDRRFEAVDLRFDAIDRRFDTIDLRFDAIDRRFAGIDLRFEAVDRRFDGLDRDIRALDDRMWRRTDALDQKVSRQFVWLVGIQMTTLLAVLSAVVGALVARV